MKPQVITHPWSLSEEQALQLQQELAAKVIKEDRLGEVKSIAGVDVAYDKDSDKLIAAVVVLDATTLEVIEQSSAEDVAQFPYIPGLFSFRELPPIIEALKKLQVTPDLIVCDGQGIAHPRRFGLACHLGVIFDIPTIGCGKTRLIGEHCEPDNARGSTVPLLDNGEVIGSVLRTQDGIRPVYVSTGHRISLATACQWVLKLCIKYRLPETTRKTDHEVRKQMKIRCSGDSPSSPLTLCNLDHSLLESKL
ncbi:endonuclease V [Fluviicoccus keumensis]|uniref:Endonuclease V n=1 Tax=Fluviicoccus keumensis TaxID=1435465 RepID=A0A4Q7YLB5_9GAMM|nr:deoxyribonuclease V [Fluviicoccus keumensis]RZU38482.1 endonuclease V [Fluviicoccus keumensis]RZU38486.1 endonuclease V [Fluviicoccus keumensis]